MINRRGFIKSSLASGMAGYALPVFGRPDGQKYKTALVGTGWWGMNILGEAMACGQCRVVAMCDVDTRQMHPAAETVNKLTGEVPKKYNDYRELLDKEKPEIVIVGTPDHWHPLIMMPL